MHPSLKKTLATALLATTIQAPAQTQTQTQTSSDHYLPLEKVQNTRDLGGITTPEGSQIKPHRLYRSGNPSSASQTDIAKLQSLKLDTILDFRAESEKQPQESQFGKTFNWQADPVLAGNLAPSAIIPLLKRSTPAQMHDFMVDLYRQFPTQYQPQFRHFLQLAEQNQTFLYHCTAGKDRTGFATVLLLSALGVDRATVIDNYLESNRYNAAGNAQATAQLQKIGVNPEVLQPLLAVDPDYIGAAIQIIDQQYGGMQHYLVDVLHVNVQKIRANYLAPPAQPS
ncbi:tyrosine-protein phosphatase [Paraburkholderia sp. D15]|uniref:tyrosine-protein phosphatase n=1 Tax=Paraburkholderia sp. D15 TaxID=2880218 RepID=UPI0024793283|nr:tyrosine-protein phosphatase [Paraburkholderia sp. D15]WGS54011.1 tyrosine-protein phosphatase [Paraburkholderia sp. D15]